MPIALGLNDIESIGGIRLGDSSVSKVYLGETEIWPPVASTWDGLFTDDPYVSSQSSADFSPVFAEIRVETNGDIFADGTTTGSVLIGTWDNNGSVSGSESEVRFVVSSSNGTINNDASTFQPLTTNRSITATSVGTGINNRGFVSGNIEIRPLGGGNAITASFSLSATELE